MKKSKTLRIAIITESNQGSASIILPKIYNHCKEEIVGIIHCKSIIKNKKNHYKRKILKTLKIGITGAILGIYMRKWFRESLKNYINILPIDVLSKKLKIPLYKTTGLNSVETKDKLASLNVDLAISLGCSYISSHVFILSGDRAFVLMSLM